MSSGPATRPSGGADAGRAALYAAELAAFDGTDLEVPHGQTSAARLASVVTEGEWWPGPEVVVRAARAGAGSSSCHSVGQNRSGSSLEIRLATVQTTTATVAHELAHALAGPRRGHDPLFRRAYLDLVTVVTNSDPTDRRHSLHVRQLADALSLAGLVVADREWPAPPAILDGPIAL